MADNTIELPFEADTSKATKSIKKFSDDAVKQVDKVSASFKLLVIAAAGAVIFKGLSSAISAAQEADRAVQKLNVSLANTGEFSKEGSAEIQAYAEELESLTGITDEAILGSFALAKSFGISNAQAKDLTSAAIELAAATGVDLDSAVKQLGGTYSGTVGKLSKLGPEFKSLTEQQARAGEVIKLVNQRFKGTAETLSGDFEGSVKKVTIAFGNIFENVGKIITQNPALIIALTETAKLFTQISKNAAENQGSISGSLNTIINLFAKATAITAAIGDVLTRPIQFITRILASIPIVLTELLGLFAQLKVFVGGVFVGVFQAAIATIQKLFSVIFKAASFIPGLDSFKKIGEDLGESASQGFSDALNFDKTKTLASQIGDAVNEVNADIADGVSFADKAVEGTQAILEKFGVAASIVDQKTSGLNQTIIDTSKGFKNAGKTGKDAGEDIRASLESAADKFKGSIDRLKASTSDLQKSLDTQNKTAQELIDVERERATQVSRNAAAEADALFKLGKLNQDQLTNVGLQIAENERLAESVKEVSQAQLDANNLKATFAEAGAVTNQVFNGEEGARQFISGAAAKLSDKFLFEGSGQFVGPLITALSKGGDFAKTAITEFINAIPVLIDNIIEAIPVIVDTLVDVLINQGGLVKIATALVKASVTSAPIFARALIEASAESAGLLVDAIMSYLGPRLGETFAQIGQNLKNGFNDFFKPLIDPIQRLINAVDSLASSFGGGGGKGVLGETADRIGLGAVTDTIGSIGKGIFRAEGGLVPGGAPFVSRGTDTVPAMLTPGELVVPTDLVGQLSSFLSRQSSGSGGGSEPMLAAILSAVMSPIVVQSEVKVNENAFADIILQLNRQNARLA